jgi:hypothetical protein
MIPLLRGAAFAGLLSSCATQLVLDPACGVWSFSADEADRDGDGFSWCAELSQVDCDDDDAEVHPDAAERCDGVDTNCDGLLPAWELDDDADGRPTCAGDCDDHDGLDGADDGDQDGWSRCMGDCDDRDHRTHPGAIEACDGLDNDCDGRPGLHEADGDDDGWPACLDCDDDAADVAPGKPETCDNRDQDCDDEVDDGCR